VTIRGWALATALCGSLDLLYAFIAAAIVQGRGPADLLRGVAAGPFGDAAATWGATGSLLGILTHFAIMGAMVAVGLTLLSRPPLSELAWWKTGALYGIVLYFVMYGGVLPLRFGVPFPNPDKLKLAVWFAPHILCVGWPLALIAQGRWLSETPRSS
jgi:hypothetical protein